MLTLAKEIDDDLDDLLEDVKDEIKDLVFAIEKDDKEWIYLINKRLKEKYGCDMSSDDEFRSEFECEIMDFLKEKDVDKRDKKYLENLFENVYLAKTKAEYRIEEETGSYIDVFYIDGEVYYWNMPYSEEIERKMSEMLEERENKI